MSQTPEHPTPTLRPPRTGFPIIPVMGLVGGMVWAACLTAMYIVRQWRLARQAEIAAAERVALMTRGKGRWPRSGG